MCTLRSYLINMRKISRQSFGHGYAKLIVYFSTQNWRKIDGMAGSID